MRTRRFNDPIIVRHIRKGGNEEQHNLAWKVAYADFVTAMMAFFLLLWLYSTTTAQQKTSLAEYFTPTIGVKDSRGVGFASGQHANTDVGLSKSDLSPVALLAGQPLQGEMRNNADNANPETPVIDADASANRSTTTLHKGEGQDIDDFARIGEDVKQMFRQDEELKQYENNIVVQDLPEGVRLELIDDQIKPMFIPGGAVVTEAGKKAIRAMANIIIKTHNPITIAGHTARTPMSRNPRSMLYSDWELSTDRANAVRRYLMELQLDPTRMMQIIGMADRDLLVPTDPNSPRNLRITIILMRKHRYVPATVMPVAAPQPPAKTAAPPAEIYGP